MNSQPDHWCALACHKIMEMCVQQHDILIRANTWYPLNKLAFIKNKESFIKTRSHSYNYNESLAYSPGSTHYCCALQPTWTTAPLIIAVRYSQRELELRARLQELEARLAAASPNNAAYSKGNEVWASSSRIVCQSRRDSPWIIIRTALFPSSSICCRCVPCYQVILIGSLSSHLRLRGLSYIFLAFYWDSNVVIHFCAAVSTPAPSVSTPTQKAVIPLFRLRMLWHVFM